MKGIVIIHDQKKFMHDTWHTNIKEFSHQIYILDVTQTLHYKFRTDIQPT